MNVSCILKIALCIFCHTAVVQSMGLVADRTANKQKLLAVITALERDENNAHKIVPCYKTYPLALVAESDENTPTVHALIFDYRVALWIRDSFNARPLHLAARGGALQNLRHILRQARLREPNFSGFINHVNQGGKTALHSAIGNEKYACAEDLVQYGDSI